MTVTLTTEKYRAHPGDFVLADTTTIDAFDVVLPPVSEGGPVQVHNITGTNAVTVKTEDGATIDGGSGSTGVAYTDAQTGATFISDFFKWYSIPTASGGGGGNPTRFGFVTFQIPDSPGYSSPQVLVPLVPGAAGNYTLGNSLPIKSSAAGSPFSGVTFQLPNDAGAPMLVSYVEVAVSSADQSQFLLVGTPNDFSLSVPADGSSPAVTVGTDPGYDLNVIEVHTGADLSISDGNVVTTAGGIFFVQIAFAFTV